MRKLTVLVTVETDADAKTVERGLRQSIVSGAWQRWIADATVSVAAIGVCSDVEAAQQAGGG